MKTLALISTNICQHHNSNMRHGLISYTMRQTIRFSYLRLSMRSSFENLYMEDEHTSINTSLLAVSVTGISTSR